MPLGLVIFYSIKEIGGVKICQVCCENFIHTRNLAQIELNND